MRNKLTEIKHKLKTWLRVKREEKGMRGSLNHEAKIK